MHSSTLVTAGVYLLYRFSPADSQFLVAVGLLTTLIAGLSAFFECDIKKIIALSTLRQLGLIITSLGLGCRSLCFAHLNTHAGFKALMFVAVGTLIHTFYGSQEVRSTTALPFASFTLFFVLVVATCSMCGLVFYSGWVTKEAILEIRLNNIFSLATLFLFYMGIGLTVLYSVRLVRGLIFSQRQLVSLTQLVSIHDYTKGPLLCILFQRVATGVVFDFNNYTFPSVLCLEDKILVYGVLAISLLLL